GLAWRGTGARLSAPGGGEPERREREDARDRPGARIAEGARGRVGGVGPARLIELQSGATGDQEQPPQIEAALHAVLEPDLEMLPYEAEITISKGPPHEVQASAPRVLFQARRQRELAGQLQPVG